ncbi:MAG: hypothetical protein IJ565_03575 [Bacilli bacterium]|nr:hypothetical protein [Bacilli bacterium]
MNIKKLKVGLAAITLGSAILIGCHKDENFTNYSKDENGDLLIEGTYTYDYLDNIKIVTFKQDDIEFTRLVVCKTIKPLPFETEISYIDVMSGVVLYEKNTLIGKDLEIVSEKKITPYLYENDMISKTYDINDIIKLYNEKILPTLDEEELVK